jgi:uncharacterized membrane protein YdcZ (DUF606 family)
MKLFKNPRVAIANIFSVYFIGFLIFSLYMYFIEIPGVPIAQKRYAISFIIALLLCANWFIMKYYNKNAYPPPIKPVL